MTLIKIFGYLIAAGVLFTSLAMLALKGRWQRIESAAYSGDKRPAWFVALSVLVLGLYLASVAQFIMLPKAAGGWVLALLLPFGWLVKGVLVIFSAKGRGKVSSISGDKAWMAIGLSRLPVALLLAAAAYFA
ncbi:MAG: hypothetical protein KKA67_02725 [Spirochaetes bacterium]|nr:hypothetical protein [Spirochaetota bacterium]MBU1080150.1 hypothetical protein [Spirochaetota bacterium]